MRKLISPQKIDDANTAMLGCISGSAMPMAGTLYKLDGTGKNRVRVGYLFTTIPYAPMSIYNSGEDTSYVLMSELVKHWSEILSQDNTYGCFAIINDEDLEDGLGFAPAFIVNGRGSGVVSNCIDVHLYGYHINGAEVDSDYYLDFGSDNRNETAANLGVYKEKTDKGTVVTCKKDWIDRILK